WIAAMGIGRGDSVALLLPNCPDYPAIWLGIASRGSIAALINTNLSGAALAHCLALAQPRLVIIAAELHRTLEDSLPHLSPDIRRAMRIVVHRPEELPSASDDHFLATIDDTALLIYTSGTTGLPKAARISHRRIMNWSLWFKGMLGITPADRMYDCLPLYHSTGGVVAVGSMLAAGGSIAVARRFSASSFWDDIVRLDCTL